MWLFHNGADEFVLMNNTTILRVPDGSHAASIVSFGFPNNGSGQAAGNR